MACERIKAAITITLAGDNPVKAILDPYNPTGSTRYVNFTTSKPTRWQTDPRRVTLIGSYAIATGKRSFAELLSPIRVCARM